MAHKTKVVPPGKCWGYCRGSTEDQEETLLKQQGDLTSEFQHTFKPLGYTWGAFFIDRGVSGGTKLVDRPGGYELLKAVSPGDLIMVAALDRAFRNLYDFASNIDTWQKAGIRFCDLGLKLDTGTPAGEAMLALRALFGQFERRMAGERMRAFHASRKARGLAAVGRFAPYGYRRIGPKGAKRLVPFPEQRKVGRMIVGLIESGMNVDRTYLELARQGVQNPNTKDPFPRGSVWRYYQLEKALQAKEAEQAEQS